MFGTRTYDYTKEHLKMDRDDQKVWCTHCGKILEARGELPDYSMFMGSVWIKQNLPCKPYEAPDEGSDTPHRANTAPVERKPKATPTRDKG